MVSGAVGGWNVEVEPALLLGFLAGHKRPTDGLGVLEYPGLDSFVFSGGGHR
jgi:hypothetical protein